MVKQQDTVEVHLGHMGTLGVRCRRGGRSVQRRNYTGKVFDFALRNCFALHLFQPMTMPLPLSYKRQSKALLFSLN